MFAHERLLQPQLENDFSEPRLLWFAFESKLYIIISLLSNTRPPSSSPSSAPGFCPDHETPVATPWFSSSNIPTHLTPPPARDLLHFSVPECWPEPLFRPARLSRPFPSPSPQVPAGAQPDSGAGAGSEPWAPLPALLHLPGPGRAGMAAAAAPSSALRGARIAPGSLARRPCLGDSGHRVSAPAGEGHRLFPTRQEFRGKSRVCPKSAGGKEDLRFLHGDSFVRFPLLLIINAIFPKTGCWARGGNINRCILWKLAVHFCGAQALHWKCRDPRGMGTRDHSSRRKNPSSDKNESAQNLHWL